MDGRHANAVPSRVARPMRKQEAYQRYAAAAGRHCERTGAIDIGSVDLSTQVQDKCAKRNETSSGN